MNVSNAGEGVCHVRGVKRDCELNKLDVYHVTENYSIDIMHTLLEGTVGLELGCVLYCLITENNCLVSNI